jgi:WD40 repeat protein
MEFVGSGKLLVTESSVGGLVVWSRSDAYRGRQPGPPDRTVLGQLPHPDGKRLLRVVSAGTSQREVQVADIQNGNILKTITAANESPAKAITISASGNRIGVGHGDGTVTLFDGVSLQKLTSEAAKVHQRGIRALAFSGDGNYLATASEDNDAFWWGTSVLTQTGGTVQSLARFSGGRASPEVVNVSPDGSLVAIASQETDVFESASGKLLFSVPGTNPTFSPDSKLLATGGIAPEFRNAKIWDARSGREKAALTGGHRVHILSLTFGPESNFVLTGDAEGWIRAWDVATGARLGELP